jgi:imidazolonepropionase-like amidohydrolase
LIAWERLCNVDKQAEYENEPEMSYISESNKKAMRFLMKASNDLCIKKGLKPNHYYIPKLFEIIKELKKQGAGILLGTDKSTPYVIAGFSAHKELEYLNKAGLSPYESIQAGTINGALCLKKEKEIGTIEIGKKADFILLKQNPLEDISVIKNHNGVMKGTKWLSREICDSILAKIRK